MAAIGTGRSGIQNTTYSAGNSTTGFSNTTPTMGPVSTHNYNNNNNNNDLAVDIDHDYSNGGQYTNNYNNNSNSNAQYQQHKSMESMIDRILKRGPPQSSLGNPGPLGLAGFAATTFMLSCYNADLMVASTKNIVLPMALWYGGLAQLLAGMWEFAANNTFGAVAFTSYGAFWLSYATIGEFYAPAGYATGTQVEASVGIFLLTWAIFTFYMMIASLRMSVGLFALFFFLDVTFILLTAGTFITDPVTADLVTRSGGWFGIATAFIAWYCSAAVVINGTFGVQLLPLGVLGPLQPSTPVFNKIPFVQRQVTKNSLNNEEATVPTETNTPMVKRV